MSTETTNKKIKIDNGTTFGRTYTDKAVDELLKNAGGGVGVIELSDSQVQSINSHDTITFTAEQANLIKQDNIGFIVVKYQGSSFYKLSVSKATTGNDSIYTLGGFAEFAPGFPLAITLSVADFTQPAKILYRDLPEHYLSTVEIGGDDSLVFSQNDDVNYTRKIYVDKINDLPIMHGNFDESKNYSFTEDKSITIFGKHSVLVPKDSAEANILPCTPSDNGKVLSVVNGEAQWASAGGGSGDDYIVKISTLFTPDEINNLIQEVQVCPENGEIKVLNKSQDVVLEDFNGNIKRIIVDLSEITSKNTDYLIFNCGVNSTTFGETTSSFSWFTGNVEKPCMNIFTLLIEYVDGKYLFRGYRIWHSGYSAFSNS